MKQFVLPGENEAGDSITLTGKEFRYLCVVRRYRPGDAVPALTPGGHPLELVLTDVGEGECRGRLTAVSRAASRHAAGAAGAPTLPRITLCQATLKGRKFDQVVRQATEAGVDRILPIVTRYTVADPRATGRDEKKLHRWQTIAREAVQQSGRGDIPVVEPPRSLEHLLDTGTLPHGPADPGGKIFFHEKAREAPPLHKSLVPDERAAEPEEVYLLLGPEGGLSPEEVAKLRRTGWRPGFLGPHVLRSETAAVYALAAVQTVLREVDAWA